jgi:C4-dicarboxylate transporter/malic acid transport protein
MSIINPVSPAPSGAPTTPESPQAQMNGILQSFHPGWFGAVMGTAIVGVAAALNPGHIAALQPAMRVVSVTMAALAYLLALALGIPYIARWIRHPAAAWRDLQHPVLGALYATFPAGLLVLATTTAAVGPGILPPHTIWLTVAILTAVGGALALVISVLFAYILFVAPSVPVEMANGGWFIPPVVAIIVPLATLPLLPGVDAPTARLLLLIGYAAWGMGFLLFLLIAALLYSRHIHHALPAAPLAPSLWIGLGPIGVGSLALIRLAPATAHLWGVQLVPVISALSTLSAAMLWGFGVWWLATAVLLLIRYWRQGPLPYGVGWWAFTFPLGAYTVSTLALGRAWQVGALEGLGAALFLLLVGFWLVVTTFTLIHLRTGLAWKR